MTLLNNLVDLNPTKGFFSKPYDSSSGIPVNLQLLLIVGILLFGSYVVIRVWLSLKKDNWKNNGTQISKKKNKL